MAPFFQFSGGGKGGGAGGRWGVVESRGAAMYFRVSPGCFQGVCRVFAGCFFPYALSWYALCTLPQPRRPPGFTRCNMISNRLNVSGIDLNMSVADFDSLGSTFRGYRYRLCKSEWPANCALAPVQNFHSFRCRLSGVIRANRFARFVRIG